jgi:hypothetical protein
MRYRTKTVKNISTLIKYLKSDTLNLNIPVWFRGHGVHDWVLESRLIRENRTRFEKNYIDKFKQNATLLLSNERHQNLPYKEYEWLFLMQHNDVPTRLLDWTENPLVALYFVINEQEFENDDGCLWVLLPTKLNEMANLGRDLDILPSFEDTILTNWSPSRISDVGVQNPNPVAAIAPRNNRRMQAQLSVFTISSSGQHPIDRIGRDHIWKYQIPASSKRDIIDELKILSINKFTLFPELDNIWKIISIGV